uniref:Geranylgeranyl transferase type II subunit alpha n=1 Tax=Syphacia muris TaxID=451379 RepID=A0A0N5AMV1_9BILA
MHFVKKVPTSEEEKEVRAKKQRAKLRVYTSTRDAIFMKRLQGELDEQLLTFTGNILLSNPEIATFWNIRREVINSILDAQVSF